MFKISPRPCIFITGMLAAILAVTGCPPAKSTVPNIVGMTQTAAEEAITGAGLTVGAVTEAFSGTVPAGNVISQDLAAGATVAPGTAVALVVSLGTLTVQGRVLFDDGSPVEGAEASGSIPPEEAAALAQLALRTEAAMTDWTSPEFKANPPSLPGFPSLLLQLMQPAKQLTATTDANGDFTIELIPAALPAKVLVEVSLDAAPLPVV